MALEKTPLWKVHVAQIIIQLCGAGYFVLAKATLSNGVNGMVFPVYQKFISTCVLAFFSLFIRKPEIGALTPNVMILILFAAFTGVYIVQILFLAGLALTSGAFAAALQNCVPCLAFFIAVLCGFEKIYWKRRDGQLKLMGVIVCIIGSITMALYQGPVVLGTAPGKHDHDEINPTDGMIQMFTNHVEELGRRHFGLTSYQIGSLLLFCCTISSGVFINLQAAILARYPSPVTAICMVTACGDIMLAVSGFFLVKDPSDWVLTEPGDLISLFYCGTITSALGFALSTWCVQRGGPFLATAYIPLQALFSAVLGLCFQGDVIYLGSILGAVAVLIGLFAVTVGQQRQRLVQSLSVKLGNIDIPITRRLLMEVDEEEREEERARHVEEPLLRRLLSTTEENLKKNPLTRFSSFQYH